MSTAVALPSNSRVGQATAIEQSRAAAEVHAAILVAQQCPRSMQTAMKAMEDSCRMKELAERAFFRYSRGGSTVSGPSVHLARELARCWGNIQYGVAELRRDDEHGQSEMQAYAWDVEMNSRSATIFIVPHKRDKTGGPVKLTDMRDIYENNANAGARRVRECILGILPPWYVEKAKAICTTTITDGGGKPLQQRISEAIAGFAGMGISEERIAAKLDKPSPKWSEFDVAQLGVVYTSIQRGEVTKEEEFPSAPVTAAEITGAHTAPARRAAEDDIPVGTVVHRQPITERQSKQLHAILTKGEINRETKLAILSHITKREITTSDDLTELEATEVIRQLRELERLKIPLIEAVIELIDRPAGEPS
jgi:hypothetical protein